jgi:hypothetical protein
MDHGMNSLIDNAFFLLFERILSDENPGLKLDRWSKNGVNWERGRHSFTGPVYGFTLDSFVASKGGRNAWSLLVMKEHWWADRHGESVKSQQWAKPLRGDRQHIFAWLSERKRALDDG